MAWPVAACGQKRQHGFRRLHPSQLKKAQANKANKKAHRDNQALKPVNIQPRNGKLAIADKPSYAAHNTRMTKRALYLAAYDVAEPKRLIATLKILRCYATGGQKSVHELLMTPAECRRLLEDLSVLLDLDVDRFLLFKLDPRNRIHTLGKAVPPAADTDCIYIG